MSQGQLFDPADLATGAGAGAAGTARARRLLPAVEVARRLGRPHPPTPEQARAIEHLDPAGRLAPCLVVAGAGSGKTETMAARVAWLVANRLVRPERILGLTFTKKAAGELTDRVRRHLGALARSGLVVAEPDDDWLAGDPAIGTYHSYAAALFREHALRAGREPSARLLGEAMTWQYAGVVVDRYAGDMSDVDWGPATVVGAVRSLAADLSEHLVSPAALRRLTEELLRCVEAAPPAPRQRARGTYYAETKEFRAALRRRAALLPLVEAFEQRKRETDSLDYGDQVALAAEIARDHPAVGAQERGRYDLVLLDEYQDTGTAQRALLRAVFGAGHPVTAVGDPCQSIYGWRGASAGNLRRFPTDFPHRDGRPADRVELTTSFRNGGRILAVANGLSEDLRRSGVPVSDLHPGPRGPRSGEVVYACHADAASEARWVAEVVTGLVAPAEGPARYAPREVAILTRSRAQFARLETALRVAGLPVEVSGLGGLLATPEVGDVVATLAVLSDAGAGPALVRLLTGARWRLGPRDLDALARRARWLAAPPEPTEAALPEPAATRPAEPAGAAPARDPGDPDDPDEPDDLDRGSLVEALDDPGGPSSYSPAGWQRICALREELRSLRARAAQPLPDLVADVVRTARLDVEVAARPGSEPGAARGHLDRFLDVAAEFSDAEESPTIPAFLAYLEAAADYERGLDTGRVGVPGDAVQVLTVHGAKGLEWPVVVVPGMTREVFPSRPKERPDWCSNSRVLPYPLRGDAEDLPVLGLGACGDQVGVRDALRAHGEACRERQALEERRLLYVAATRAEDVLVCSGYWWDHTSSPRGPSEFLVEVRDICRRLGVGAEAGWAAQPAEGDPNPLEAQPREQAWPADPLPPARRAALEEAAAMVRAARGAPGEAAARGAAEETAPGAAGGEPGGNAAARPGPEPDGEAAARRDRALVWVEEVDKLLAERARLAGNGGVTDVALPGHLSVSQLVALHRDPDGLARWIRRPVPLPPAPLARRGTAFHAWVEQRYRGDRLLDLDELPGAADAGAAPEEDLADLRARFLASEWADRQPVPGGVEVPFETVVEGMLVRGRMDAVFRAGDGTWDVVDWKTGRLPSGPDAAAAAVQLAAYRLAWQRLTGEPLERIRAAFHYVRAGVTVRPADLLDGPGLAALLRSVPLADPGP